MSVGLFQGISSDFYEAGNDGAILAKTNASGWSDVIARNDVMPGNDVASSTRHFSSRDRAIYRRTSRLICASDQPKVGDAARATLRVTCDGSCMKAISSSRAFFGPRDTRLGVYG